MKSPLKDFPKETPELLPCPDVQRPGAPLVQIQFLRAFEIPLEVSPQAGCESPLEDRDIQLVIQLQRSIIEVSRADELRMRSTIIAFACIIAG